jgi:methylated-DNA-[protein]-cysteine S-methyltransferase
LGSAAVTRKSTPASSRFADRVLAVVSRIPQGRVATYGDVARMAGRPAAARAVGQILRQASRPGLPYHRVVSAGGQLGGYGGAVGLKAALLRAEGVIVRGKRIAGFGGIRYGAGR